MWLRIKAFFAHSRTILAARLVQLAGGVIALYDGLLPLFGGQDWTPITARLLAAIPADLRPLVIGLGLAALGALFEWLRRVTRLPLDQKGQP